MKSLKIDVLSGEEISQINDTTLRILEEIGIRFASQRAREMLKKAGCDVDESTSIVKIPEGLVKECLRKVPGSFTLYGRTHDKDVRMESGNQRTNYMNLGMGTKFCHYVSNGQFDTRDATVGDICNAAKVEDACPNIDMMTLPVSAIDLVGKPCARTLHEVEAIVANTAKPHLLDPIARYLPEYFEIEKAVAGGDEEEARKRPILMSGSCTSSPLELDNPICDLSMDSPEYGLPHMVMTMAMAGTTSPITLAGTIAVHNAESLAGIVLTELAHPGCACVYGSCTTGFDFMSNTAPFGSPENTLIASANAQIARYYNIPSVISGGICDSKAPDFQSGIETMMNAMIQNLAGATNVFGAGLIELGMTFSLEQAVMVDDMIPLINKIKEGVEVTEETLMFDTIKEVGPGGEYIAQPSTLAGMFSHTAPKIFDRNMYDAWKGEGAKYTIELAHERVVDILQNHMVEPLTNDAQARIKEIIAEADKNKIQI